MSSFFLGAATFSIICVWFYLALRALEPDLSILSSFANWFSKRDPVRFIAYIFLILGFIVAVGGNNYVGPWRNLVNDFYANGATEFISIAITVLVIDRFNQYRLSEQEKQRLVLQLSSSDLGFATEASRLLNLHGWLTDGSVRGAYLHGANLSRAVLTNADFQGCVLTQAKFRFAWLDNANFKKARLTGCDLSDTHLIEANFEEAQLSNANLSRAVLCGANMTGADLTRATLRSANLVCTDLSNADLTDTDLLEAFYDENTIWPEGFAYDQTEAILIAQ